MPNDREPVVILNDCALSALRKLPDACVDCIITSPPYWGLRDYGIEPTDWPACSYAPMPGLPAIEVPAERSCLGLEPTLHAFLAHLVLIFDECRRVLKPTGSAWVNMGDAYAAGGLGEGSGKQRTNHGSCNGSHIEKPRKPLPGFKPKDLLGQPWRVAFALQAAGWYLRQDNIWHKPNPMPESIRDRATKAHEYVFLLTKSERYFFDLEAWSEKATGGLPGNTSHKGESAYMEGDSKHRTKAGLTAYAEKSRRNSFARTTKDSTGQHGQKPQFRPDREVVDYSLTRNKRSVWTVPTVAYSEAHYATYPPRLITPPLLASTSAKGCCSQCGAPWSRIVEKTLMPTSKGCKKQVQDSRDATADTQDQGSNRQKDGHMPGWANHTTTKGWQPTCQCIQPLQTTVNNSQPPSTVPCLVLDPFGGSGTTAQVALEHGRHAILIERGPHNIDLIRRRLAPFLAAPVLNLH